MAETVTKTYKDSSGEINQCDIYRDIEFIEYAKEDGDSIEVSKIVFPLAIVLTQACDLQQDYNARKKNEVENKGNQDKFLISVIVAPIYNFEEFRMGTHLDQLGLMMDPKGRRDKSTCSNIMKNENKRYHYLNFAEDVEIVESVVDFKHYFTVTVNYLNAIRKEKYVCSIDSLYRELLLQRFSNFLSRIGLPEPDEES
ncbi:MAG: hypothetical protein IJF95_00835 [Erysipelotrichaceae bacterium]|nr:hypothetical protein [Erysipelotrichaceae bacterium]